MNPSTRPDRRCDCSSIDGTPSPQSGLRWRVVGVDRKLTWLCRGIRWRVVGVSRKLTWLYRGIRWRVIGRVRKLMWFGRRRRRDLESFTRKLKWRYRRLGRSVRRFLVPVRSHLRGTPIAGTGTEIARRSHRELTAQLTASFRGIAGALELDPPPRRLALFGDLRVRNALFNRLPRIGSATRQMTRVSFPLTWEREELDALAEGRIVVADLGSGTDRVLNGIVATLISGRPVCVAEPNLADARLAPFVADPHALLWLSDDELERFALEQLRSLVRTRVIDVESGERPRVAVTMSTNRPDLVAAAVQRIAAQVDVSIDLFVGCHGFDADQVADVVVPGGAIETAVAIGFSEGAVFGDVLRDLAERAACPFVTKWDDDDLYGPHHVVDLWLFLLLSRSAIVGKAAEFVKLEERSLLVRRRGGLPYRATTFLAGGALMMRSDVLAALGSWASIPRSVDQNIIARFEAAGFAPFRIQGYEFVLVRHGRGHTWDAPADYFERGADEVRSAGDDVLARSVGIGSETTDGYKLTGDRSDSPLTICVPNQNNQVAIEIFEHVLAQIADTSIVVGDDRSDPPLTTRRTDGRLSIVRAPVRDGFGAGRSRQAAAEATVGDGVLLFADADMYLEPRSVERVRHRFASGFVGAIHGEISFTSVLGSEAVDLLADNVDMLVDVVGQGPIIGQAWREPHWARSADYAHPLASTFRGTVGAFLAIDQQSYRNTGGFRDVPVRGVEDTEFGYRLMVAGCHQRLDRDGGFWHLGERTFADRLGPDEEELRERYLSAYVPIWARTLSERRATLAPWEGAIVPFVAVRDESMMDEIAEALGPECVALNGMATSVLDAPFAIAVLLEEAVAKQAVSAAYRSLRNRRCGEVELWQGGRLVGRVIALWALNLAARRQGRSNVYIEIPDDTSIRELSGRIRSDFGLEIVDLSTG